MAPCVRFSMYTYYVAHFVSEILETLILLKLDIPPQFECVPNWGNIVVKKWGYLWLEYCALSLLAGLLYFLMNKILVDASHSCVKCLPLLPGWCIVEGLRIYDCLACEWVLKLKFNAHSVPFKSNRLCTTLRAKGCCGKVVNKITHVILAVVMRSSCTIAKFIQRKDITVWFLPC